MIQNVRTTNKRKRKDHDDDELSNDFACGSNSPPIGPGGGGGGPGNDNSNGRTLNLSNINNNNNNAANNNNHHSILTGFDYDLSGFQLSALRRYKKYYHVQTKPGLNKNQLAEVCFFYTFLDIYCHIWISYDFSIYFIISNISSFISSHPKQELTRHFRNIQVNEREIISTFIYTVQNGNKLDTISNSKE